MDAGWEEVERMAQAASAHDAQLANEYPSTETIERWQRLFGYSRMEAVQLISRQRNDGAHFSRRGSYHRNPLDAQSVLYFRANLTFPLVTRTRITDDHWSLIAGGEEALGYDREAYEHSLRLRDVFVENSVTIPTTGEDGATLLLFPLRGLLGSPEKVKEVAKLEKLPQVREGMGSMGVIKFCLVDKAAAKKLEEWVVQKGVLQK